jgi:urocanate hydratase
VVDVWEKFDEKDIHIDLGSDQTSHNPYAGGYYPTDISFEDANAMMAENPILFKERYRKHYAVTPPLSINTQQRNLFL